MSCAYRRKGEKQEKYKKALKKKPLSGAYRGEERKQVIRSRGHQDTCPRQDGKLPPCEGGILHERRGMALSPI